MDTGHENVNSDISNIKCRQWRDKGTECCIGLKLSVALVLNIQSFLNHITK